MALPHPKFIELSDAIKASISKGALKGHIVENEEVGKTEVDKMLRIERADGEQFAIGNIKQMYQVWSSLQHDGIAPVTKNSKQYEPHETRSTALNVMKKLCKPNAGRPGARAWRIHFLTMRAAHEFILSVR